MFQYVVQITGTKELFGPFGSGESALVWASSRLTVDYEILPLIYPM